MKNYAYTLFRTIPAQPKTHEIRGLLAYFSQKSMRYRCISCVFHKNARDTGGFQAFFLKIIEIRGALNCFSKKHTRYGGCSAIFMKNGRDTGDARIFFATRCLSHERIIHQKMAHEHLYNRGSCAMNGEKITHGVAQPHTAVATLAPLIFAGNPRLIAYNLLHLGQTSRRR